MTSKQEKGGVLMTFRDEIKVMRTTEGLFSAGQIYKI